MPPPRNGFCGDLDAGQGVRRLEHPTCRVGVNQERSEFVAKPERAVMGFANRLDVEIAAGQPSVLAQGCIDRNPAAGYTDPSATIGKLMR